MKTKIQYVLLLLLASFQFYLLALDRTSGISATFLKKRELMSGDSWSGRPIDIFAAVANLKKYDAIWCSQIIAQNNPKAWNYIRKNYPNKLILRYVSGCSMYPDSNLVCLNYDYINKNHPEWFLLADERRAEKGDYQDANKRTRWNTKDKKHTYYNRFYLDVANEEFQDWAAQEILSIVQGCRERSGYPYDGIAIDNVYVGRRLHDRFKYKYSHWKYANDLSSWSKGYLTYLKKVKQILNEHGFIVVANYNPVGTNRAENEQVWQMLYDSVDGLMSERALRSGWRNKDYFTGNEWLSAITRHEEVLNKGLIDWWACSPIANGKIDQKNFLYTYCSWLLVKKKEKSFYSINTSTGDNNIYWDEVFDLPIGEPLSSRYLQDNCWVRDLTNAKIVVNPTKKQQVLQLGDNKNWLVWPDKKITKRTAVSPQTAQILLQTAN